MNTPSRGGCAPIAAAVLLLTMGCEGRIDVPLAAAGPTGTDTPKAPTCVEGALPARRIIRLNDRHYSHSVRDLLEGETIDFRSPSSSPGAFVEDVSLQPVGEALASQYQLSAESIATATGARAAQLLPCPATVTQADTCVRGWIERFVGRAYRRALLPDEVDAYAAVFEVGAEEGAARGGVRLVVQAALQAPSFLYRTELGTAQGARAALTSHELAAQLSYWLLDSIPDAELRAAADANQLEDPAALEAQVTRLLALPTTQERLTEASLRWSGLSELSSKEKDPQRFPDFAGARASLLESARLFISSVLWTGTREFGALYSSKVAFVDGKVAPLYGISPPATPGFSRVEVPSERAGLFTHPAFLAQYGSQTEGQIVQRGAFVSRVALCIQLAPPPAGLEIIAPGKGLTEREFAGYRASNTSCKGCHALMDPYGLMLSAFDAVGAYHPTEQGVTVVTKATPVRTDFDVELSGAAELGARMSTSALASGCFTRQMKSLGLGRPLELAASCEQERLELAFTESGRRVDALVLALARSESFRFRRP